MDRLEMKNLKESKLENIVSYSGIVKVLWRQLDILVPESEIIMGGVESLKD